MVFNNNLLLGAAGAGGGYTIDQSIRFNDDDSAYLTKTFAGAGDDATAGTVSVWVKRGNLGSIQYIFANADTNNTVYLRFESNDIIGIVVNNGGATKLSVQTTAVYRDVSSWYHLVFQVDTSQGSASARRTLWVNGVEASLSGTDNLGLDEALDLFQNNQHYIGRDAAGRYLDGYLSEYNGIDGQALAPTEFGKFNNYGVWVPIEYTGTYGTNGFYITGEDSADLGADYSGNGNDFTSSGLTSDDQVTDTPTANSCTMNPLDIGGPGGNPTLSDGNLVITGNTSAGNQNCRGTFAMTTGKWYWEMAYTSDGTQAKRMLVGICDNTAPIYYTYSTRTAFVGAYDGVAYHYDASSSIVETNSLGVTFGNGDHIMFAFDADAGKLWFGKNGTWMGSPAGDPAAGTGASLESMPTGERWQPFCSPWRLNQGTFYFLEDTWTYTAPTGFNALSTANLPTPTIDDGSAYFQTTLYTGNGTAIGSGGNAVSQIENSTFQPDFVWIKRRNASVEHVLTDAVRGVTEELNSNDNTLEETVAEGLTSFDSSGFTVGSDGSYNTNTGTYVAWQWLAGNGTASNEDGDITSTVSVNTTSGVSVLTYSGNGSDNQTIGHGLGIAPKMIITKRRDTTGNWIPYHDAVGINKTFYLNSTAIPVTDTADAYRAVPTSSVYTIGAGNNINNSSGTYVAYVFAEIEGFSKFGSYNGNGSTFGPFIWCGFRPAFMLIKNITVASSWEIFDSERPGYNETDLGLYADLTSPEYSARYMDLLSNGFKVRNANGITNYNGATHIFMAFAEHPFGGDGVASVPAR